MLARAETTEDSPPDRQSNTKALRKNSKGIAGPTAHLAQRK